MGQPGEEQHQRYHGGGDQARQITGVVHVLDEHRDQLGGNGGQQEEEGDEGQHLAGIGQADAAGDGKLVEQCQQYHAEHVVQHRGTEHDLAFTAVALAEVGEHAQGDADAGGSERAADEQGNQSGKVESQRGQQIAQHEGDDESAQRDDGGAPAGVHQLAHVGVEPHFEEQQQDADFGKVADDLVGLDPAEQAGPQDDAGSELANDRRGAQVHSDLGEEPRRDQDDQQLKKKGVGFHAICLLGHHSSFRSMRRWFRIDATPGSGCVGWAKAARQCPSLCSGMLLGTLRFAQPTG